MALIKCIECGTEVSDSAQACPKCGAPVAPSVKAVQRATKAANKAKRKAEWKARPWWQKLLMYLVAFASFVIFARSCDAILSKPTVPTPPAKMARWLCEDYIRKHLDDPDSLEFIDPQLAPSLIQKDGSYRVTMTLRAKNRFGAKILTRMQCKVVKLGDDYMVSSARQIGG